MDDQRAYDPAAKFGHSDEEGHMATYYDDDGNRISEEKWLEEATAASSKARAEGSSAKG